MDAQPPEVIAGPGANAPPTLRRFARVATLTTLALGLAMLATIATPIGFSLWHYNASFALALVAGALLWRPARERRFATVTLAFSGSVATVTGFAMLYTKDFPYKAWITWWHSWTSFVFAIAFLAHWFNNNARLAGFTRRLFTRDRWLGAPAAFGWLVMGMLGLWTASPGARLAFSSENYLYLASWAVFAGVAFTYGTWLAFRVPALRRRLERPDTRNRARALVDTSLFLSNALALGTGFALLYLGDVLRSGEFKYVSKWWHTAGSVAFLAFLALHVGFNARILAAHAHRLEKDLTP